MRHSLTSTPHVLPPPMPQINSQLPGVPFSPTPVVWAGDPVTASAPQLPCAVPSISPKFRTPPGPPNPPSPNRSPRWSPAALPQSGINSQNRSPSRDVTSSLVYRPVKQPSPTNSARPTGLKVSQRERGTSTRKQLPTPSQHAAAVSDTSLMARKVNGWHAAAA